MTDLKSTIFSVHDDEDDQMFIREVFREFEASLNVVPFFSGPDLLAALDSGSVPTAIILDVNMPKMDGLTCLAKVKAIDLFKDTPVYILSSMRGFTKFDHFFASGAKNCFTKPSSISGLKGVVESILKEIKQRALFEGKKLVRAKIQVPG